ncbi:tetratricopeptide repeat protein [Flavobacterium sp.]|uniref:tetratricopeptide repeat-containing sensor histidine kinase n=1 Tax=Flavobacterium sp. TaxID=239 RepID=UPI00334057A9
MMQNQNDSAYTYYLRAEKNFKKLKNNLELAKVYLNKSVVQYNVGDFSGASLNASKSYFLLKNLPKSELLLYQILTISGNIANELGEYEKALDFHKKALEIVKTNDFKNDQPNIGVCLNNIGNTYKNKGEYKKSIDYFQKGLKDDNLKNDPELLALLYDNLGYSKLKLKKYDDLPNVFFKAKKISDSLNFISTSIFTVIHLSEYYSTVGQPANAINYAKIALFKSKKENFSAGVLVSLKQLSLVDKLNSSKYTESYIKLSDSLQTVERNSRDRFAKIELETDEILQQKDSLEKKNRNILNYFIGTIAVGGLLFFMRAQRAKSRELLLRQAQQRANEDIYRLIISQQNKLEEGRVLEKNRIAKELHDGVLGRLFGLRLNLDGLNHRNDEDAIHQRIHCLEELKNIEQDLREISHELSREKYVLVNNFVAIVNNLLDEQAKVNPAKLNAVIRENIDWDQLNNTTKINLYRILQESLQNINKYANAKTIKVEFRKDKKGNLVLNITDDGDGFEVDKKSKGIGLKNIVTRTHESNGIIEIKSAPGKGTRISITAPLEHKNIKS